MEGIGYYLKSQKQAILKMKEIGSAVEREVKEECERLDYTYLGTGVVKTHSGIKLWDSLTDNLNQRYEEFKKEVYEWYKSSIKLIKIGVESILKERKNSLYLFAGKDTLIGKVLGGDWYYLGNYPENKREVIKNDDYRIKLFHFLLPKNPLEVYVPDELIDADINLVFTKFDASGFKQSGMVFSYEVLDEDGVLVAPKSNFKGLLKDLFEEVTNNTTSRIIDNWVSIPTVKETPIRGTHLSGLPGYPYPIQKPIFLGKINSMSPSSQE